MKFNTDFNSDIQVNKEQSTCKLILKNDSNFILLSEILKA